MTIEEFLERHGEFLRLNLDEDLKQLGNELRKIAERRARGGDEANRERPRRHARRHIY